MSVYDLHDEACRKHEHTLRMEVNCRLRLEDRELQI